MARAKPDELLTVPELARRWGVTPQRVDQMVRDGLPLADKTRPRRVSLKTAEAFRAGYTGADGRGGTRPGAGRRKPARARKPAKPIAPAKPTQAPPMPAEPPQAAAEPAPDSLAYFKREKARLEKDELERRLMARRGELVPVAAVRAALVEHAQRCRRQLERTVTRVTDRILLELKLPPAARSHVERILSADMAATLTELADMPPLQAPAEPAK